MCMTTLLQNGPNRTAGGKQPMSAPGVWGSPRRMPGTVPSRWQTATQGQQQPSHPSRLDDALVMSHVLDSLLVVALGLTRSSG